MLSRLALGGVAAAIVVFAAYSRRSLSLTGAIAGLSLGLICAAAGWGWSALLVAFFISGTVLSRYQSARKTERIGSVVEKGGERDASQVLANGGVFSASALASLITASPVWLCIGAAAIGASAADTWATEIGVLSRHRPRSILSRRVVSAGESGGVTTRGTFAALFGASAMALVAYLYDWGDPAILSALIGGIGGCTIDSILGATVQTRRWCDRCRRHTERSIHDCGTATSVAAGLPWMTNDTVNALSSLGGAIIGFLVYMATQ
ncbi:MAG: DUF92 domain-containing protein [Gemmatimonadaceae bacterium]